VFERPALTDHPIHDLLARRWSTRAYTEQSIDAGALESLLEAARWSPSSGNGQPWRFVIARKEDVAGFERIASTLAGGNAWAKKAAVLMVAVAALDRAPGKPNPTALFDVGLACENMALQATSMGLSLHMMGGFNADMARELLQIPDRFVPICAISVGYPADPNTLSEELRAKDLTPRVRKPLSEVVFNGAWGQVGGTE
jgi:nitroreductase